MESYNYHLAEKAQQTNRLKALGIDTTSQTFEQAINSAIGKLERLKKELGTISTIIE